MMRESALVKVSWKRKKKGWKADLLLANRNGFDRLNLATDRSLSLEVTDDRRCTGYAPEKGERTNCPEFREISSGSQCSECRAKDIYSDYVRGDSQTDLEGEFSVYVAQISDRVKVGVTRTGNVRKRWVEQGADYGAEILHGLESGVALQNESRISDNGLTERIRKENKIPAATGSDLLRRKMDEHGFEADIIDVNQLTVYPEPEGKFMRKGLFEGELKSVKGQIISNSRVCMGISSGKVVKKPDQKGLSSF